MEPNSTKQTRNQNITRDIEIKNKVTVTKGEVGGDNGRIRGRVFRNMYKGHIHKTKGGKIKGGEWGWLGQRNGGEEMETTVLEQQ